MATKPRERSESGFYHVFQRGVNHFDIFEDDDDRTYYKDLLVKYACELDVEVHAWCLMSNHTHLLVRTSVERLSAMMMKLGSAFARFFNSRHGRSGPLFGSRFSSVCVETDAQLVSVVRYIHRNPIEHDERTLCADYAWSSYAEYLAGAPTTCKLDFVLGQFGNLDEFVRQHEEDRDYERHIDIDTIGPMRDEEARRLANDALSRAGFKVPVSDVGTLTKKMRDDAIALVRSAIGCSLRQIQRLTAMAYSAIKAAVECSDFVMEKPMGAEKLIAPYAGSAMGQVASCGSA